MTCRIFEVCVVTGTRAEYGLLKNIISKFNKADNVSLKLVVTGSHLESSFGNTQNEIIEDGFEYIKLPIPMDDDSKEGMAYSTGVAMMKFSELFREYKPDIMLVLGDRFEIFSATAVAHLVGIPVAHLSGGDVTEGAVDNAIRHCLTQMSYLHFPGCEQSAKRIIQMGEDPARVYNVGEPGVENCLKMPLMTRKELADNLNKEWIMKDYAVVTFHPVTMENNTAEEQVYELIKAMDNCKNMFYIITMANADAGGRCINDIWLREERIHTNWLVVTSLGVVRYLSALKYAKVVIGNSSSGVVEAPTMKVPTVNIGGRQKGRMMAESVICCESKTKEIYESIKMAISEKYHQIAQNVESPFGDGTTSDQVVNIIMNYLDHRQETIEKHFFDIDFEVKL